MNVRQQDIEDLLTVELGISQEETMQKHIHLLVRLGYLKVAQRGLGKEGMLYDVVGKKIEEARRALASEMKPTTKREVRGRR